MILRHRWIQQRLLKKEEIVSSAGLGVHLLLRYTLAHVILPLLTGHLLSGSQVATQTPWYLTRRCLRMDGSNVAGFAEGHPPDCIHSTGLCTNRPHCFCLSFQGEFLHWYWAMGTV